MQIQCGLQEQNTSLIENKIDITGISQCGQFLGDEETTSVVNQPFRIPYLFMEEDADGSDLCSVFITMESPVKLGNWSVSSTIYFELSPFKFEYKAISNHLADVLFHPPLNWSGILTFTLRAECKDPYATETAMCSRLVSHKIIGFPKLPIITLPSLLSSTIDKPLRVAFFLELFNDAISDIYVIGIPYTVTFSSKDMVGNRIKSLNGSIECISSKIISFTLVLVANATMTDYGLSSVSYARTRISFLPKIGAGGLALGIGDGTQGSPVIIQSSQKIYIGDYVVEKDSLLSIFFAFQWPNGKYLQFTATYKTNNSFPMDLFFVLEASVLRNVSLYDVDGTVKALNQLSKTPNVDILIGAGNNISIDSSQRTIKPNSLYVVCLMTKEKNTISELSFSSVIKPINATSAIFSADIVNVVTTTVTTAVAVTVSTAIASSVASSVATSVGTSVGAGGGSGGGSGGASSGAGSSGVITLISHVQFTNVMAQSEADLPASVTSTSNSMSWMNAKVKAPIPDVARCLGDDESSGGRKKGIMRFADDINYSGALSSKLSIIFVGHIFWVLLVFLGILMLRFLIVRWFRRKKAPIPCLFRFPNIEIYISMLFFIGAINVSLTIAFTCSQLVGKLALVFLILYPLSFMAYVLYFLVRLEKDTAFYISAKEKAKLKSESKKIASVKVQDWYVGDMVRVIQDKNYSLWDVESGTKSFGRLKDLQVTEGAEISREIPVLLSHEELPTSEYGLGVCVSLENTKLKIIPSNCDSRQTSIIADLPDKVEEGSIEDENKSLEDQEDQEDQGNQEEEEEQGYWIPYISQILYSGDIRNPDTKIYRVAEIEEVRIQKQTSKGRQQMIKMSLFHPNPPCERLVRLKHLYAGGAELSTILGVHSENGSLVRIRDLEKADYLKTPLEFYVKSSYLSSIFVDAYGPLFSDSKAVRLGYMSLIADIIREFFTCLFMVSIVEPVTQMVALTTLYVIHMSIFAFLWPHFTRYENLLQLVTLAAETASIFASALTVFISEPSPAVGESVFVLNMGSTLILILACIYEQFDSVYSFVCLMRERVFSMMAYLLAREKPDSDPKSADLNLNGNSVHAFIRINEGDETANWMSRVDEPKATQSLNKTFLDIISEDASPQQVEVFLQQHGVEITNALRSNKSLFNSTFLMSRDYWSLVKLFGPQAAHRIFYSLHNQNRDICKD